MDLLFIGGVKPFFFTLLGWMFMVFVKLKYLEMEIVRYVVIATV